MYHFRAIPTVEGEPDSPAQEAYLLALIAAQLSSSQRLQAKLTEFAGYAGCREDTTTKLLEARAILETYQAKIIEAISAQAIEE